MSSMYYMRNRCTALRLNLKQSSPPYPESKSAYREASASQDRMRLSGLLPFELRVYGSGFRRGLTVKVYSPLFMGHGSHSRGIRGSGSAETSPLYSDYTFQPRIQIQVP